MEKTIVDVCHIDYMYQQPASETLAICDLSFSVRSGEFVSIVGPSGCGKTTVLSLLMGILSPTRGEVRINGDHAGTKPTVGYMLQRDHLLDWRTVEQNVLLGLEVKRILTPERRAHALSLLERYGLKEFSQHYPRALSGGMRQKVALIRTLATEPSLLLLDEPFSALDYQTRLLISDEIYGIIRAEGTTTILVTHDISEAVSMSDRILVFTERPARLQSEHVMPLANGDSPLSRRKDPRFTQCFNLIWKEMTHHGAC